MFDINASLTQQRCGERKVLHIHDSEIDCTHPIAVWLEGGVLSVFTRDGKPMYFGSSFTDLHTLPEPLPLIVSYHNVYRDGISVERKTLMSSEAVRDLSAIATICTNLRSEYH